MNYIGEQMHLENLLSLVSRQHRFMKDVLQLVTLEEQKEIKCCKEEGGRIVKHCTSVGKRLGYFL